MHVSDNTVIFRVALPVGLLGDEYIGTDGKIGVLANGVSGAMDVVTTAELAVLEQIRGGGAVSDPATAGSLLERGYVYPDEASARADYRSIVDGYFETIKEAPFQFMFIPSFVCNLACPYCFEGELTKKSPQMTEEMIDAAFDSIPEIQEVHENSGPPYITLFGGEPLLDTPFHRWAAEEILRRAYDRGYPATVITNGVDLDSYVPLLKRYGCEEIQVSLDGPPAVHDQRRVFRNGRPTFDLIAHSIDTALEGGLRVLVRVLVDKQSVGEMPAFAELAAAKGWIGHPGMTIFHGFTKQTAFLYVTPDHPQERRDTMVRGDVPSGLQDAFYAMLNANPLVDAMLKPDPARIRSAVLDGDRIHPNLQGCSAGTSVMAFDPSGRLYGCPETVGRPQHACGGYYPEYRYASGYREPWRHRHVDTVEMCRECNVRLFCGGGGCPIKAWAASGGNFNTCYCPKVETIKTRVQSELEYLLPMVLRDDAPSGTQPAHGKETSTWRQMTEAGSFPWMQ
jgi:uncharacterized protein